MREVVVGQSNTLIWLFADQLSSTAVSINAATGAQTYMRYAPFGAPRLTAPLPTDHTFTGQRNETGTGLMDYGARFYDPLIGRFISADTIVPGAGNPQALNRYTYAFGNPLKYTDPSGHIACNEEDDCYEFTQSRMLYRSKTVIPYKLKAPTPSLVPTPPVLVTPQPVYSSIKVPPPVGYGPEFSPPQGTELPDGSWEWGDNWPSLGPGWRNKQDDSKSVWRPDLPKNKPGDVEGEDPHWQRRRVGEPDAKYPPNPEWGRGTNDRKQPGNYNEKTGRYDPLSVSQFSNNELIPLGVGGTGAAFTVWMILKSLSPLCGPAAPICAYAW